jgi:hypothetical protein
MDKILQFSELPSRGLVYTELNSADAKPLSIRTFKGRDEKLISELTADNFEKRFVSVLKGVLQGIDPLKLTIGDRLWFVLYLTINSYSKNFTVSHECNKCYETNDYTIDLSQLEIIFLPDSFKEPFELKLPVSGDLVKLRLLRVEDLIKVDDLDKAKQNVWLYRYALSIVNEKSIWDNVDYLEKLDSKDIMPIRAFHDKFQHGPKMTWKYSCPDCGGAGVMPVPFRLEMLLPYGENLARAVGDSV